MFGNPVKLCDTSGTLKDSIYIDGTINKTKLNRLSAENADGTEGILCVSVQRKTAVFDVNGNAIPNNTEWITSTVTQYAQNTAYIAPALPNVTNMALSTNKNYIITVTPLDATTQVDISGTRIAFQGDVKGLTTIQYLDGLGRPAETVQRGITPAGKDLVVYTEYDDLGREWKQWLPVSVSGSGGYVDYSAFSSNSQYNGDARPYAEMHYELCSS